MLDKEEVYKLIDQVYDARVLVKESHGSQLYGNKPYTYHLDQVRDSVINLEFPDISMCPYGSEDLFYKLEMVALMHDLLEDTEVTSEKLLELGYPEDVVAAVVLVTKVEGLSYTDYLRNIVKDDLAFKVKVADTYCNLTESLKDGNIKRIRKYSIQIEKLYKLRKDSM